MNDPVDSYLCRPSNHPAVENCNVRGQKTFIADCASGESTAGTHEHIVANPHRMTRHATYDNVFANDAVRANVNRSAFGNHYRVERNAR